MSNFEPSPLVIRLYPNRRLYDGEAGHYRGLHELRTWKQRQVPFAIVDPVTGDDVTERISSES